MDEDDKIHDDWIQIPGPQPTVLLRDGRKVGVLLPTEEQKDWWDVPAGLKANKVPVLGTPVGDRVGRADSNTQEIDIFKYAYRNMLRIYTTEESQ